MSYEFSYIDYILKNDENINIDQVEGLSRVETRKSENYISAADGGNIWAVNKGMRVISIYGSVYADDLTTYYQIRRKIQRAFNNSLGINLLTITRSDGLAVTIPAQVTEIPEFKEVAGEFAEANFNIIFKCPDPEFLDTTENVLTLSPGSGGGSPVKSTVPTPVGLIGGKLIINNSGDEPVVPEFRIDGQINNATPFNETTGESFVITENIEAGDFVQAYENNNGTFVELNGVSNYFQFKQGTIWELAQGTNAITFNGTSFDDDALLTLTYRLRYNTI